MLEAFQELNITVEINFILRSKLLTAVGDELFRFLSNVVRDDIEWQEGRLVMADFKKFHYATISIDDKISFLMFAKTLLQRSHWPKGKEQMELSFT